MKDNRTDEELNRIIAEWCGWTPSTGQLSARVVWNEITGEDSHIRPPNYCRDLNAVHESEEKLSDDQQFHLVRMLTGVDESFDKLHSIDKKRFPKRESWIEDYMHRLGWDDVWSCCIRATARQRAEALVKVIEEGKK